MWYNTKFIFSSESRFLPFSQILILFVVVQLLSCFQFFVTPWTTARRASLSFTISRSLFKFMSIELVMPSNHLILCHPLFLLPKILPSIRVFSNGLAIRIRWPKYWSFSFISPSNEYSGLISCRIDWFDFLAVQGTLKSLLQHHSSKASILWCSAFFMVLNLLYDLFKRIYILEHSTCLNKSITNIEKWSTLLRMFVE